MLADRRGGSARDGTLQRLRILKEEVCAVELLQIPGCGRRKQINLVQKADEPRPGVDDGKA
jgi:hypothetical protein